MMPFATTEDHPYCLIVSPIAVRRADKEWRTLDLWARDVNAQARQIPVSLVCPVIADPGDTGAALDPAITVVDPSDRHALAQAIANARYIQLPGGSNWHSARLARWVLKTARALRKPIFLGISSNRARTTLLNSGNRNWVRRAVALLRYTDIRFTQRWLARRCTGVFVVGAGLIDLVQGANSNIHVGTASWISEQDVHKRCGPATIHRLRVCMAGRLERMKGFHVGLAALEKLQAKVAMDITLIGSGPEKEALETLARRCGLAPFRLLDPVPYPAPFFAVLDEQDLVLLTNLNDEQPRLVFDALCRGALPVCPDAPAYTALGLDRRLLYRQGDADALAQCVGRLTDVHVREELLCLSQALLARHTLSTMHTARLQWMAASATQALATT